MENSHDSAKYHSTIKIDSIKAIVLFLFSIFFTIYFDLFDLIHDFTREHEEIEIDELFPIIFFTSLILMWFSYKRVNENRELIDELKEINQSLKIKVENAVKKERKRDKLLIKQSKIISMAELINNIAHHWRQPLSVISLSIQNIIIKYRMSKKIESGDIANLEKIALAQVISLSQTIDNFRHFFITSNKKEEFNIKEAIEFSLLMLANELENSNIKIDIKNSDFNIYCYKSEFIQIVLSIIKNSCEAIIMKQEENKFIGYININTNKRESIFELSIEDNGGGIDENIIEKIYEPYFSTKFEMKGIGLGLFMAKEIIEREMNGKIYAQNSKNGTKFTIELPIKGDN